METKARLIDVYRALNPHHMRLIFETEYELSAPQIESITGKVLRLKAVQWKEKRSLDANAYMWQLITKIAVKLNTSSDELYELFLQDAGVVDEDPQGEPIIITMKSCIDPKRLGEGTHWKRISVTDGCVNLLKIKGTSEYNTKEMSDFIDYVVEVAKDYGIETATPDEIERYKALWKA